MQTGDILTFSLTNKSTPNKHIPPTADAVLVSLNWLGPGHTFRSSYAAQADSPARQHVVTLDTKSSTATYVSPDHPFPASDRTQQNAYIVSLQKWDVDSASNEENKSLVVVGDFSSVDLEILGNIGIQWFRHSQDNPLTLPLDKSMDDTILLALAADITDTTTGAPIIYAYLNDGSLQGWHAEYTKRYVGLISPGASSSTIQQIQESTDSDMATESVVPTPPTSLPAFGQSSFSQPASVFSGGATSFGKTGFGQTQGTSSFGQQSFGQPAFGQNPLAFGQNIQASHNANSAFSSAKPATGFGAFAGSGLNAFGSGGSGLSSSNAFTTFGSATTSQTFGQGSFNAPSSITNTTTSSNLAPTITQEASMSESDTTPGFGGLSLGGTTSSDSKTVNSMFGSFGTPTATSQQTNAPGAFGGNGLVKPATGFGAFGASQTSGAFDLNNKPAPTSNSFSSFATQTPTTSGFGQPGFSQPTFGQSSIGKPGFGQATFGKTSFGGTPSATSLASPTTGGFSGFANAPPNVTVASQSQKSTGFGTTESKPTGGFASFASAAPVTFGSLVSEAPTTQSKPESGGFSGFAPTTPASFSFPSSKISIDSFQSESAFATTKPAAIGTTSGSLSMTTGVSKSPLYDATTTTRTSVFGTPFGGNKSSDSSPFGQPTDTKKLVIPVTSPPSSPEPSRASPPSKSVTPVPPPTPAITGSAFANIQTTPSGFRPAAGFGAFGSTTPKDSPFFKKPEQTPTPPAGSAFLPFSSPALTVSGSTTTTPSFGSTSVLGVRKASVVPATPSSTSVKTTASTGAFSAFGGSSSPFSAFTNSKKSFSDLLKTGEGENKEPEKPSTLLTPVKDKKQDLQQRTSVFGTPKADEEQAVAFSHPPKDEKKKAAKSKEKEKSPEVEQERLGRIPEEPSSSNVSVSSTGSSFVEVTQEVGSKKEEEDFNQDSDHQDDGSDFLTDEDDLLGADSSSDEGSLPEGNEEGSNESSTPLPAAIPLPLSRSTSVTPQPDIPKVEVFDVKPNLVREPSTTPPGTPFKEAKALSGTSNNLSSSPSPFGIGLGRPSTRPARSSPLANAVVLGADSGSEQQGKTSLESEENLLSNDKQPKTPPLLSVEVKGAVLLPTPPSATPPSLGLSSDGHGQTPILAPPPLPFNFNLFSATNSPEGKLNDHTPANAPLFTARAVAVPTTSPSPPQSGSFAAKPSIAPTKNFGSTNIIDSASAGFRVVPTKSSAPLDSRLSPQILPGTSGYVSSAKLSSCTC